MEKLLNWTFSSSMIMIFCHNCSALALLPVDINLLDERANEYTAVWSVDCGASGYGMTSQQKSSLPRHAPDMSWDYELCETLSSGIVCQRSSNWY